MLACSKIAPVVEVVRNAMRTPRLEVLIGAAVLAGTCCVPALAHRPYFSEPEAISAEGYSAVELKLLHGDGVLFADPMRAVVVGRDGELLAASPQSPALQLSCDDENGQCLVYDELAFTIYEPAADKWQARGLVEQGGEPQRFPEDIDGDYGFDARRATLSEIVRFEAAGLASSWMTTGFALAWWTVFCLLLLTVARDAFGKTRRLTIGAIVGMMARTAVALVMIPLATYAWLLAPYSVVYLAVVLTAGALLALPIAFRRRRLATPRASAPA